MITCTVCQHDNIDGVMFCEKCGHELGSESEAPNPFANPLVTARITPVEFIPQDGFTTEEFKEPLVNTPSLSMTSSSQVPKAKLTAKSPESPIKELIIDESPFIIGKFDPDTGVVDIDLIRFPDAELISRNHAELSFDGSNWQITDLNSTNGTYLKRGTERAAKITQPETLREGDRLSFANIVFTFSLVSEAN